MGDDSVIDISSSAKPVSEEDWIIHAVNIHGLFFERACRKIIEDTRAWEVSATNLPVEFPLPTQNHRGKESNLDIKAELRHQDGRDGFLNILTLLIECKKNNPGFVKWLFFPKHKGRDGRHDAAFTDRVSLRQVWLERNEQLPEKLGVFPRTSRKYLSSKVTAADEAREIRSSYTAYKDGRDKTKTANAAISEAAYQIALAAQAIFFSETSYLTKNLQSAKRWKNGLSSLPWARQIFIPAIVTSARLFTCDFDPGDIDMVSGEIPFSKATIKEEKYLLYEYPLPRHLQAVPSFPEIAKREGDFDLFNRMHIFVVHSGHLSAFLGTLAKEDFWTFV